MKVLWTTNMLICGIAKELNGVSGGFGGWMEQAFEEIVSQPEIELAVITSGANKQLIKRKIDGVTYYVLPCGDAYGKFRARDKKAKALLKNIVDEEKPNLIHIWGTESELGLALCDVTPNVPAVVYLQGIMKSVEQNYYQATPEKVLKKNLTIYDFIKRRTTRAKNAELKRKTKVETAILKHSGHIICDNEWCVALCRSMNSKLIVHPQNLPIDKIFSQTVWENTLEHKLFCASQYAPFKGFEVLIRALSIVKEQYPDVVLEVPGGWQAEPTSLREKMIYGSYSKTINKLIKKYGLQRNIKNVGGVTRKQMAEHMKNAMIFVQCSTVENHSSTMREAMNVGVPCIASDVGSAPEYILHGKTGFLYRSNESEVLAYYIMYLFENEEIRKEIGRAGKGQIQSVYANNKNIGMVEIYHDILK